MNHLVRLKARGHGVRPEQPGAESEEESWDHITGLVRVKATQEHGRHMPRSSCMQCGAALKSSRIQQEVHVPPEMVGRCRGSCSPRPIGGNLTMKP